MIQLDLLPTILAAAGVKIESGPQLDGVNLLPFVKGQSAGTPHVALYWRLGDQSAVRRGDWKLVRYDRVADDVKAAEEARAKVGAADDENEPSKVKVKVKAKAKTAKTKDADDDDARTRVLAEVKVTQPRLYNLARDPGEKVDLATAHPEKVAELQDLWNAWASQLKEPLWRPSRQVAQVSD